MPIPGQKEGRGSADLEFCVSCHEQRPFTKDLNLLETAFDTLSKAAMRPAQRHVDRLDLAADSFSQPAASR